MRQWQQMKHQQLQRVLQQGQMADRLQLMQPWQKAVLVRMHQHRWRHKTNDYRERAELSGPSVQAWW